MPSSWGALHSRCVVGVEVVVAGKSSFVGHPSLAL